MASRSLLRTAGLGVLFVLAGCLGKGDCTSSQNSSGQVAVCNHLNSFSYTNQALGYSKSESYTWKNSLPKAQVDAAVQINSGTIQVTLKDAGGKQVFSKTFSGAEADGKRENTANGSSGPWTVGVTLTGVTGQFALTLTASP